ncbi:hypothetical protein QE177_04715 [Arsenophonus sp. aPb]|uniref:hypothetical protein n=1 Tax=Arsenophonus sp. aPb TaxID=3041619 RepID=UPI0024688E6A|nr:hypothetical protein [Arsenophonus sp. aPb]WGL99188.1 hypothetical protein QE177_04715 [Arsenophonus sp. aPb]
MSVWDVFSRLNRMQISIGDYGKTGTIYGNGKNQIIISVKVVIIGLDNRLLIIPDDELFKAIHLVHYKEGKRLNRKGNNSNYKPWIYTDKNFGYVTPGGVFSPAYIVNAEVNNYENEQVVTFYLYATEPSDSIQISAGIDIPGVGDFNTSEKGTLTRNGPKGETGSVFKQPDFISVNAKEPIDYSRPDAVELKVVDFIDYPINDIKIKKIGGLNDVAYFNGISKQEKFSISSASHYFTAINIIRSNKITDLNTVKFYDDVHPDMIVGLGGKSFSSYFVFVHREKYGLMPGSCIYGLDVSTNNVYKYEIDLYDNRHFYNEQKHKSTIDIDICQHNMPLSNVGKFNWNNKNEEIKAEVTDYCGNSGIITIEFNYENPSKDIFIVNGK